MPPILDPDHPIRIRVPATTANLGPGFDCLGMALDLFNEFEIRRAPDGLDRIEGSGACAGVSGGDNLFFRAWRRGCAAAGIEPVALDVRVSGEIPQARGLGSSATAVVAGVVAADLASGGRLGRDGSLVATTREEGHPDNVAPALLGGLVAAADLGDRVPFRRVVPHAEWRLALLVPGYPLATEEARRAIPRDIPLKDAVFNLVRVPLILEALANGDAGDLAALMDDRLHQPYRSPLIRGWDAIREAALGAGAASVFLSGAGPTMAAFCLGAESAGRVARAMRDAVAGPGGACEGIECDARVASPLLEGAVASAIPA